MGDTRWEVAPQPLPRAAIMRRVCAFAIDAVLVGAVVALLASALFDVPAQAGVAARACGFAIALAYFGWMNSGRAGGQTLGKRLLGIRAQHVDGTWLSVPRAFARYAVLGVPFSFSGVLPLPGPTALIVAILVAGLLLAIVALFLFDRSTRRSLHDRVVGSWVVSDRAPHAPMQ